MSRVTLFRDLIPAGVDDRHCETYTTSDQLYVRITLPVPAWLARLGWHLLRVLR